MVISILTVRSAPAAPVFKTQNTRGHHRGEGGVPLWGTVSSRRNSSGNARAADRGMQASGEDDAAELPSVPVHRGAPMLSVIAYNLGNLRRRLALPKRIGNWSPTSLQQCPLRTFSIIWKAPIRSMSSWTSFHARQLQRPWSTPKSWSWARRDEALALESNGPARSSAGHGGCSGRGPTERF